MEYMIEKILLVLAVVLTFMSIVLIACFIWWLLDDMQRR